MRDHHAVLITTPKPTQYELSPAAERTDREEVSIDKIGIDSVRSIIERANRRPNDDATTLELVIRAESLTIEAQQALLKVVEEPPLSTRFIFILPSGTQLLPTLRSRFSVGAEQAVRMTDAFAEFLSMSYAERLNTIERAVKEKNISWQIAMQQGLTAYLKQDKIGMSINELERLQLVVTTMNTRGAANKMLLEEAALTL